MSNAENIRVTIYESSAFKEQAQSFEALLECFNISSKELQNSKVALHDKKCMIYALIEEIEKIKMILNVSTANLNLKECHILNL